MGLDMYLRAIRWLSKYDNKEKADEVRSLFPEMFLSENIDSVTVIFEVGYWRKANHIHDWFVQNVQSGRDDCGRYYVSREDMKNLLGVCETILKSKKKSKVLLPVKEGFFFGNTEYDKYYYKNIEATAEIIKKCLALPDVWEFEYHASW